jgi:CheY-like chemotaxis protein
MKLTNLKVVIAEDDRDDGKIIYDSFESHPDFKEVHLVKNGLELLNFLKSATDLPDVILTDLNMPIMDGIEAMEAIFSDPRLFTLPVFVFTSSVNPEHEKKCRELGVKGFLVKPFELSEFYDIPYKILYLLNQDSHLKDK